MKKTLYLFFIISLVIFINSANTQETTPEEYSIKKGDTLWDISDSKFNDSFLWPNLWRANPQIKNPDLIHPGDKIRIPSKEELIRLPAIPEERPAAVAEPVTEEEKPVVVVPVEKPKKYIVNKNLFISSGWISNKFPGIGEIFNSPNKRSMFGKHDLVYLKSERTLDIGDKFFTIRAIKKVKHPKNGKLLGKQIRITGILEVIGMDGADNNIPKAQITSSFEDILIGDGLIPYSKMQPPVVPDTVRTPDIMGYIVESYMNNEMVSEGNIVYLDKGNKDGLEVGDTFSALIKKPVERSIGTIQVFSLQPKTSSAIILDSEQDISIGDIWGKK